MRTARLIRVWDWPLRLAHWGFAVLIPFSWWSAENSHWGWHERSGLTILGLLMFRILWGFIGPETARFAQFVPSPAQVLSYVKGQRLLGKDAIGHNPLGALSVIALLVVMLVQVSMGLFAGDPYDGLTGPLNSLVGVMTADAVTEWHETFFWVVLGLVVLHLAAIVFYAVVKRNDLVSPMITGKRSVSAPVDGITPPTALRIAVAAALSAGFAVWIALGAPPLT